jgi:four helix bundle protein
MNDLSERLFNFADYTIKFLRDLPNNTENKVIKHQLIKSATSSGANYEESQAGSSRKDFANKIRIALREMRESNYWLRLIKRNLYNKNNQEKLIYLIKESFELMNILGAILTKVQ